MLVVSIAAPSEITGQPYAPSTEREAVAHAAAPTLRAVLRDMELGEPLIDVLRALAQLRGEVVAVNAACAASDYGTLGEPGRVFELARDVDVGAIPSAGGRRRSTVTSVAGRHHPPAWPSCQEGQSGQHPVGQGL